jgi:NAD(P)-dependent dehydrogenase (short-subunit alcohol dehydrogenase family)
MVSADPVDRFDLSGKVAVVTGSSRGIGRGLALGLAEKGADLVITSRSQIDCEATAEAVHALGRRALVKCSDVTDLRSIEELARAAEAEFGRVDILVNNAGSAFLKAAEELTEEDWDRVIDVDLKGVFLCSITFGRGMIARKSGKIINIASILGLVGDEGLLPYCVAKGGVVQMTRALAVEWAKYNIQVNALCPGYAMTAMNEKTLTTNERVYNHIIDKTPMRRLARVEEFVGAALLLASDASSYMTGQTLVVDGGWTAE